MYLDQNKLLRDMARAGRRRVVGLVLTALFGLGTVWGVIDYEGLRSGLDVYVFCLAVSLWVLVPAVQRRRRLKAAKAYEAAFSQSRRPELTLTELAAGLGRDSVAAMEKELRWLLDKGYLVNCGIVADGVEKVVLSGVPETRSEFIVIECPHCGAGNSLRRGAAGRCEYCGGAIKGE